MIFESFETLASLYIDAPAAWVEILNEAFQATQNHFSLGDGQIPNEGDISRPSFPTTSESLQGPLVPPLQRIASPLVLQASRLAAAIYLRAIQQGIPFEDARNTDQARQLGVLLAQNSLSAWRGIPYVYLWM